MAIALGAHNTSTGSTASWSTTPINTQATRSRFFAMTATGSLTSVTDNFGNVWTQLYNTSASGVKAGIWTTYGKGGTGHTLTLGFSSAADRAVAFVELTGADFIDANVQTGPLALPTSGATAALNRSDELAIALLSSDSGSLNSSGCVITESSGMTIIESEVTGLRDCWAVATQSLSSNAAKTATFNSTNASLGGVVLITVTPFIDPPVSPRKLTGVLELSGRSGRSGRRAGQTLADTLASPWSRSISTLHSLPPTVSGGGNASTTLTGASGAAQAGTVTARGDANVTLTGAAGSLVAGTVTASGSAVVNANVTLTGVSAAAQAGTITATGAANTTLTGATTAAQAGAIAARGDANTTPTGAAGSLQAGAVTASGSAVVNANVTLTGVSAAAQAGAIAASGSASTTLTGAAGALQTGTITATGAANTTLTGVSSAAQAGTITARGDANVTLTGAAGALQAGTATANGTTSGSANANLTGAAASAQAGSVAASGDANVTLTGAAGSLQAGSVSAAASTNANVTLIGAAGSLQAGSIAASGSANRTITGAAALAQAGAITGAGTATTTLTGAQASFAAGALTAFAQTDVTITAARANLIYELALLHGLVPGSPLTVSATARTAGNVVQTVAGTDTVTITTVSSDVLHGDVNVWIDALAAVYGLTAPLVVTQTSRAAGALAQTISSDGTMTTVSTP